MTNWQTKKLGEIFEIQRGGSPRPIKSFLTDSDDGINWIKIGDTKDVTKYIYKTKEKIKPEGLKKSRLVTEGDFILSNSMSFGRPYIMKTSGAIHDGWLVFHKKLSDVDIDFFYYLLGSPLVFNKFDKLAAGSTVRNLNTQLVSRVSVPLPPLHDQQRIVKILDKAFDKIDKAKENVEKNLQNSKDIFESYLQKTFDNTNNNWNEKPLKEICDTGAGGTPLKAHRDYYENGKIPWLRSGEINKKDILKSELFITKKGFKNSSARKFPPNTVLIAMYGATAGQVGILRFESTTNQAVCGILPNDKFLPEYLYYVFSAGKTALVKQAVGGAQPNISQIKIKDTLIPILSLEEQEKIVAKLNLLLDKTKKLKSIYQQKLNNLDELKKSILNKAFNGEL